MKYPKCVYRIGNESIRKGDNFAVDVGFQSNPDIGELVSITAETLAELAKENGERIYFYFDYTGLSETGVSLLVMKQMDIDDFEEYPFSINKDEPLGEFFLRVAKERNYLK